MKLDLELKNRLIEIYKKELLEKMNLCQDSLEDIKNDISNETKSSAGDKFETSREMMQQEREKNEMQLQRLKKCLTDLNRIHGKTSNNIENGTLLRSGTKFIFFFPGLNNMDFEGRKIYSAAISSPLGQALRGKKINMEADFRGQTFRIDELC